MARVTVEDCVDKTETRFELIMMAAQRARKISSGAPLTVERDNDKNTVIALREIADETIELEGLKEDLIRSHQRILAFEDEGEGEIDLMDGEEEWSSMAGKNTESTPTANIYGDEEIVEEESAEAADPSLADLAGDAPAE